MFALASACGEAPLEPSAGACTGELDRRSFSYELDPDESAFYLASDILIDEDAQLVWSFGEGRMLVRSQWQNMPYAADVGSHPLPVGFHEGDALVEVFTVDISEPESDAALLEGELTLNASSRRRIAGSFWLQYAREGEVSCAFELSRDYERDEL